MSTPAVAGTAALTERMKARGVQCRSRPSMRKKIVGIQIESGDGPLGKDNFAQTSESYRADNYCQEATVLEPLSRHAAILDQRRWSRQCNSECFRRFSCRPSRSRKIGHPDKTVITMRAVSSLCQVKIVWVNGIRPLILKSSGGIDPLEAINRAADEESPSAHTLPTPRYAAAPAAR